MLLLYPSFKSPDIIFLHSNNTLSLYICCSQAFLGCWLISNSQRFKCWSDALEDICCQIHQLRCIRYIAKWKQKENNNEMRKSGENEWKSMMIFWRFVRRKMIIHLLNSTLKREKWQKKFLFHSLMTFDKVHKFNVHLVQNVEIKVISIHTLFLNKPIQKKHPVGWIRTPSGRWTFCNENKMRFFSMERKRNLLTLFIWLILFSFLLMFVCGRTL